jgi:hypothetical protein
VASLGEELDASALRSVEAVIRALESSFPVEDAYNRLGSDSAHKPNEVETEDLVDLARHIWAKRSAAGTSIEDLAAQLNHVEPFSLLPDIEKFLRKVIND